jgi:hypothetical protein
MRKRSRSLRLTWTAGKRSSSWIAVASCNLQSPLLTFTTNYVVSLVLSSTGWYYYACIIS